MRLKSFLKPRNISLWWKFEGRYYYKKFKKGVQNLIRWFPIIWRDRDWDHHFIWVLLIHKLKFQSNYIGKMDFHSRAKRDAEIMMTCVRLMDLIKDEWYSHEYMDYQDCHYDFIPAEDPGYLEMKTTIKSERFEEYFQKYPLVYKKVMEQKPGEERNTIAFYMGMENHKRAKKILFRILEDNIESWWD